MEEVLERHGQALREKLEKLDNAADNVRRLLVDQPPTIAETANIFSIKVKVPQQIGILRQRLMNPATGIRVSLAEETVDIKEVYRRGITRKRPASEKGEELRDVIVWLSVLHYAKEGDTVAFISRDSGFWDGAAGLHSDISSDISSSGSDIRIYRDIEEFNKANALTSKPLDAYEIKQVLDVRSLDAQIIEKAKAHYDGFDLGSHEIAFRAASVLSGSLESGTLYEVEAGTKFAEVPYRMQLEVTLAASKKWQLIENWLKLDAGTLSGQRLVSLRSLEHPEVDEIEWKLQVSVTGLISMRIVDSQAQTVEVDTADFGKLEFDRGNLT